MQHTQAQVFITNDTGILLVPGLCGSIGDLSLHSVQSLLGCFKACRTRPLCGAAHVKVFKLRERPFFPWFEGFFSQPGTFFCSHYCRCKAHQHNALPLSPLLFHKHTWGWAHTPHSIIRTQTHKCRRRCPPPSFLSTVYIKAVSNCTLSLIGSVVQCAAVDSDKSFFQSLQECLPTAMSEHTGGEKS